MVSGCFDLLHSGHVAFLEEAAGLGGELHVAIGSDRTVLGLKGRPPINSEQERKYLLEALRCVSKAYVSSGSGILDFLPELDEIKPTTFFVNADGDNPAKRQLIESRGIEYVVSKREPRQGLAPRSTTSLRQLHAVPYRLDLAGGWLDQPFVSTFAPGPVINCSLEPKPEYATRSGLASSTRQTAITLWGPRLPSDDREKLARIIFAAENPPGTEEVAGSQDAIGVVYPGVNRIDYDARYWPERITTVMDGDVLDFLDAHLYLVSVGPRPPAYSILSDKHIDRARAKALADAANDLWDATLAKDARRFGKVMTASLDAQVSMFPRMLTEDIRQIIAQHAPRALGHKITGAGGGGYVVLFSEQPIEGAIRPRIRRED